MTSTILLVFLAVVLFTIGRIMDWYYEKNKGIIISSKWNSLQEFLMDYRSSGKSFGLLLQVVGVLLAFVQLKNFEIIRVIAIIPLMFLALLAIFAVIMLVVGIFTLIFHPIATSQNIYHRFQNFVENTRRSLDCDRADFIASRIIGLLVISTISWTIFRMTMSILKT